MKVPNICTLKTRKKIIQTAAMQLINDYFLTEMINKVDRMAILNSMPNRMPTLQNDMLNKEQLIKIKLKNIDYSFKLSNSNFALLKSRFPNIKF